MEVQALMMEEPGAHWARVRVAPEREQARAPVRTWALLAERP